MDPRVKPGGDENGGVRQVPVELTDAQFERYARHLILDEVGEEGQARLMQARVLVVGAGGLGSPLLLYLAAAGVGTIGIADDDEVSLSNLQRQIVHSTQALGEAKVKSARRTLASVNPETSIVIHDTRLVHSNVLEIIEGYDIVADGSDNFATRYLLTDACFQARKILVSGSLLRFEGQLSTFKPWTGGPCYRCLFAEAPPPDLIPRCEEAGILGSVAGVIGTVQATEILKEILGLGQSLSGRLMIYDALSAEFRTIRFKPDPNCRLCGPKATIRDLSEHKEKAPSGTT
ncbi:MAG: molybdopterin-synthase adenylyltransferase MoeB [Proteobacteria bacterium]|nr:molybdopterin-synthase adenylyltransferase MoeB [Pseudomonadota bacterium]MBI3499007.1 molybdopterin-synthase adenylyltransferase MoeB [Pseudomonadota bacterium]